MSDPRRAALWCAVLAALGLALWLAWPILTPFLVAMGIAYMLDPLVGRIAARGVTRTKATAGITLAFGLLVVGTLAVLVPVLVHEIPGLIQSLLDIARQVIERVRPVVEQLARSAGIDTTVLIGQLPGGAQIASEAASWAGAAFAGLVGGGMALINLFSLVFLTPFLVFYLLRDWPRIMAYLEALLPRDHVATIVALCREIDERIAGFLRGQALVCLLLGVFYAVGLTLAGLRYGLVIGLLSGIVTFVPIVGVLVGAATGIIMAFFQFDDWGRIGAVAFVFALGQFLEGNFATPKLVGDRVGLHPVWVIVALLVGGVVGGLVGVMLSVPVAAAVAVLLRYAIARYVESPLYLGRGVR